MFNRRKVRDLEQKVRDLKYKLERRKELVNKNDKLTSENIQLAHSIEQSKSKIRKQTEADIYFASAKIMKELENGTKKKTLQKEIDYRDRLLTGLEAQGGMEAPRAYSSLVGALGGLGTGLGRGYPY